MARRKDATRAGWAGEDGDLFLISDGVDPVWDTQAAEVYPDAEAAGRAWPLVRAATWAHPDRLDVWPPQGAVVYDGLVSRTEQAGPDAAPAVLAAAVAEDLARLAVWRREHPDAAEPIAAELDAYAAALHRLAALARTGRRLGTDRWLRTVSRVSRGPA